MDSVEVSVEALQENRIYEVTPDGREIYVKSVFVLRLLLSLVF